jgi:hypothetical protein
MWNPAHIRINVIIKKNLIFWYPVIYNVYQMKCVSPVDVIQFKKYCQDTIHALWSSVVTAVRRTPDLCFLVRELGLQTTVLWELFVDGGIPEFVLKEVKEICAIRDTVLLQYV